MKLRRQISNLTNIIKRKDAELHCWKNKCYRIQKKLMKNDLITSQVEKIESKGKKNPRSINVLPSIRI